MCQSLAFCLVAEQLARCWHQAAVVQLAQLVQDGMRLLLMITAVLYPCTNVCPCCRYHSMDQYALIDNPAMIDKALEVSGASKLAFVGHSQVKRPERIVAAWLAVRQVEAHS